LQLTRLISHGCARTLLALASTLAALAAAEIVARLWLAPDLQWFQPVFRADPHVGYTLKPGNHGVVLGAHLRANAHGYRGAEVAAKEPGLLRVALLGDSHAFGYGVEEDAAVAAVLASTLARTRGAPAEVLNFALPGYSARQALAVFEHKALPTAPDVVVLVLCDNDERPDLWVDADGWLRGGTPGDATAGRADAAFLPSRRLGLLQHSRLVGFAKLAGLRAAMRRTPAGAGWNLPIASGPVPDVLCQQIGAPVRALVARCRALNIPVVLALFGSNPDHRRLLSHLAAETNAPALDLVTLFPECTSWDHLLLRFGLSWDPHLGAAAHARWGSALADRVLHAAGAR
jgi:lysophospholipase L1-like esterase